MAQFTLDNGLHVSMHKMSNTHSITVALYVKAGSAYEKKRQRGVSHMLEHLHFRRMGELSQDELYYQMESMGSTLKAVTHRNFMAFSMKIAPFYFKECLKIFRELITASEWTNDDFMKEKQVVLNQIHEKNDCFYPSEDTRHFIFYGNPLENEIMGDVESVNKLELSQVQKYKEKVFSTSNMELYVTGNIEPNAKQVICGEMQQMILSGYRKNKILKTPDLFGNRNSAVFLENSSGNFLNVNIAFDIKYDAVVTIDFLRILNCILGEGVGSRLQKRIREKLGYSSDIASELELYREFAVLHIDFSVYKEHFHDCLREIINILYHLKKTILKEDLDVSLPFYTSNLMFNEDDTEEMNFQLAYNNFILGIPYKVSEARNDIETIERLKMISNKIFNKENVSVIVWGNVKMIKEKDIKAELGRL